MSTNITTRARIMRREIDALFSQPSKRTLGHAEAINILAKLEGQRNDNVARQPALRATTKQATQPPQARAAGTTTHHVTCSVDIRYETYPADFVLESWAGTTRLTCSRITTAIDGSPEVFDAKPTDGSFELVSTGEACLEVMIDPRYDRDQSPDGNAHGVIVIGEGDPAIASLDASREAFATATRGPRRADAPVPPHPYATKTTGKTTTTWDDSPEPVEIGSVGDATRTLLEASRAALLAAYQADIGNQDHAIQPGDHLFAALAANPAIRTLRLTATTGAEMMALDVETPDGFLRIYETLDKGREASAPDAGVRHFCEAFMSPDNYRVRYRSSESYDGMGQSPTSAWARCRQQNLFRIKQTVFSDGYWTGTVLTISLEDPNTTARNIMKWLENRI